ncbi:helix-turn-helix domain-containing protein [Tardiphaga sp. 172_B4_N1_3]
MSQVDFGSLVGLAPRQVSVLENGHSNPKFETIVFVSPLETN